MFKSSIHLLRVSCEQLVPCAGVRLLHAVDVDERAQVGRDPVTLETPEEATVRVPQAAGVAVAARQLQQVAGF